MDQESARTLRQLLTETRVVPLGTLGEAGPVVSLVPIVSGADLRTFYIHISQLAQHTQDIVRDPRVGLLFAEPDHPTRNPQSLARVSLTGTAEAVDANAADYASARARYLATFPDAAITFGLGDFAIYRLTMQTGRFVAGFGRIYKLNAELLRSLDTADA